MNRDSEDSGNGLKPYCAYMFITEAMERFGVVLCMRASRFEVIIEEV